MRRITISLLTVAACLLSFAPATALAFGQAPQWTVTSVSAPTNFTPGNTSGEDLYRVQVMNTGGAASDGEPVTISDELPDGLALATAGASAEALVVGGSGATSEANFKCVLATCTYTGTVVPEQMMIVKFPVDVLMNEPGSVLNVVRVAGGGAPDASVSTPTVISSTPAGFGISPGGASTALSSTQAGAHSDITTSIAFNTIDAAGTLVSAPDDLVTEEPPGFAGDLVDTPTCAPAKFSEEDCPSDTQIGITTLIFHSEIGQEIRTNPVYNLAPNPGEVAKFGFVVISGINVQGNVSVRQGDYGLRVSFQDANQAVIELDSASLTVWGVPAASIHNPWRWKPEGADGHYGVTSEVASAPYFTNPTSCGEPLVATFDAISWEGQSASAEMPFGPIVGCGRLSLPASFTAEATSEDAETPTGLNVNLGVKQTYENAEGLASSTLNKAVVTLPEGMTVNPSAGAGLAACSLAQYEEEGLEEVGGRGCPNESKLGTVEITTPALAEKATGSVFLAQPYQNLSQFAEPGHPNGSLLALYVVARFPQRGVLVKVAGKVSANPQTGRLVTTFERQPALAGLPGLGGLPPVPFTTFSFMFHPGATAPLVTPPVCGSYAGSVALSPWSEPEATLVPELHAFAISHGVDGGACPSGGTPSFKPQVISGTQDNNAGSYSPFYLRIVREDGEQEITKFTTILPPGLTGNLTGIPFCPEADIEAARSVTGAEELVHPSCPAASEVGHTITEAGVGGVLAQTPGKVYLAGPYHGAALSVVSITAAKVGPFDLGTVVIRFALSINPLTAQVEINGAGSDPIPHIIDGIVVHVRDIRAYISREKFIVNPTSCNPMGISDTITGAGANPADPADQGSVTVPTYFQAADCSSLKFKPTFKVSTSGKTSRTQGASLSVKLTYPSNSFGTQANIKTVKVDLPKQLPSRLTTLQKACTAAQFDANPAGCPLDSRVGQAKAITPILPVPLEGPAYFVSYGGAKFPELVIVLQGYGFTIDLHGETFISKAGITSSTFHTVPDEPVGSFELTLPEGPYSALAANGNLCKSTLKMPTAFTAQNGAVIHQSTPISVSGCPKTKKAKARNKHHKKK